ncbi:MAG: exodeoxyribonuclease VII small subunit [Bacteroidota bacterium]
MTYEQALTELEEILTALRTNQLDIDKVEQGVKRASELIHWCRARLRTVEGQLDDLRGDEAIEGLF